MALKQDERALLQLVCERGQSYADLAELLAISEDEVRDKARTALTELGGSDPDAEVGLTDYLLGQADPIGRADAVRYLQGDAAARELAATVVAKLGVICPDAELPKLPGAKGTRRKAAAPTRAESQSTASRTPGPTVGEPVSGGGATSSRQARLIAGLAGAGVVLLFAILAVAGVFSGDDGAQGETGAVADAGSQGTITPVPLKPEDGSGVAGNADFALENDQLVIDVTLDGLDPKLEGKSVYVLWLMVNRSGGYPVSIVVPKENGSVDDRYVVPTPVAVTIAGSARFVQVSESPATKLRDDIDRAVSAGAPLIPFAGRSLALGRIPLAAPAAGEKGSSGGGGNGGGSGNGQGGGATTAPGG